MTTKPLTIRVDEATKRKFFAALALNGETMQTVLARAVAAYIAANTDNKATLAQ